MLIFLVIFIYIFLSLGFNQLVLLSLGLFAYIFSNNTK